MANKQHKMGFIAGEGYKKDDVIRVMVCIL
jgi:hypothetical protein